MLCLRYCDQFAMPSWHVSAAGSNAKSLHKTQMVCVCPEFDRKTVSALLPRRDWVFLTSPSCHRSRFTSWEAHSMFFTTYAQKWTPCRPAVSNRNALPGQKLCYYLYEGRTSNDL